MYVQKLNKCRTLAEFNNSMIPATTTENTTSQQNTTSQETSKDTTKEQQTTESKQADNNQEKSNESDQTTQQPQAQTQYLFFGPDEFLITSQTTDSGWWYGYKDTNSANPKDYKFGFFPSTFVQVIEKYENQMGTLFQHP